MKASGGCGKYRKYVRITVSGVQNSVFECVVDATQLDVLKMRLMDIIDKEEDSLRFYQLGNNYKNKVEHVGIKESIDLEGPLIM